MGEKRAESPSAKEVKETETKPESEPETKEEIVNMEIFQQILDLDDEETHEFSREMVWEFFRQASETFKDMDTALEKKDLSRLSSLGHFLKGSSAALGLSQVQSSCESIQHVGDKKHVEKDKTVDLSESEALTRITALLETTRHQYDDAEKWLKDWYEEHEPKEPEE